MYTATLTMCNTLRMLSGIEIVVRCREFSDVTGLVSNKGLAEIDIGEGVMFIDMTLAQPLRSSRRSENLYETSRTPNDAFQRISHHYFNPRRHSQAQYATRNYL